MLHYCTVLCIVGNKTDLVDRRAVSKEDGLELAHDHSAIYLETSAATGEGAYIRKFIIDLTIYVT